MNGTIAGVLAVETQSHLISVTEYPKASDRILAVIGVAQGDGNIPVAALCTLWARGGDAHT